MMNKEKVEKLRAEINRALEAFGQKENLLLRVGNARFLDTSVTFKLKVCEIGKAGMALTPERAAFKRYAEAYGLDPEVYLDRWFRDEQWASGHAFQIIGWKERSSRTPVMVKRDDGAQYRVTVAHVRFRAIFKTAKAARTT